MINIKLNWTGVIIHLKLPFPSLICIEFSLSNNEGWNLFHPLAYIPQYPVLLKHEQNVLLLHHNRFFSLLAYQIRPSCFFTTCKISWSFFCSVRCSLCYIIVTCVSSAIFQKIYLLLLINMHHEMTNYLRFVEFLGKKIWLAFKTSYLWL